MAQVSLSCCARVSHLFTLKFGRTPSSSGCFVRIARFNRHFPPHELPTVYSSHDSSEGVLDTHAFNGFDLDQLSTADSITSSRAASTHQQLVFKPPVVAPVRTPYILHTTSASQSTLITPMGSGVFRSLESRGPLSRTGVLTALRPYLLCDHADTSTQHAVRIRTAGTGVFYCDLSTPSQLLPASHHSSYCRHAAHHRSSTGLS